ncbi:hypothetical protein O9Z70_06185 [Devosia sp. YIM 151766]|uniref:hypothetical protein n=1 Tax=Devosia sp. YIM 151766 TaxID=3017325 RepID=UPI00255CD53B|nr:hypothetical protein [Devosia sp. YIM 151766]WIY54105.1 hypothetical protein O9Z70_06185 [Devosia sp. YIM 151766]
MVELNEKALEAAADKLAGMYHGDSSDEPFHAMTRMVVAAYLSAPPAPDDGLVEGGEMSPEEIRLENLKQMAAYDEPVVSFEVQEPYYLASCDRCGWVGSSERCGTDSFGDDSDVYCPRCFASGVDCGKVAERLSALQSKDEQIERLTHREAEAFQKYVDANEARLDAEQQVQKLTAENERLGANIVRLTGNPVDYRYWEGRYRDEATENERLREALTPFADFGEYMEVETEGFSDTDRLELVPEESDVRIGDLFVQAFRRARSVLETQEGGE